MQQNAVDGESSVKISMKQDHSADTFALIRSRFGDMPARFLLKEAFIADYRFDLGGAGGVLFGGS